MARLTVRLTPRGGRDAIDGWTLGADGRAMLKARVAAAPSGGAANAALIALLAKALGRPASTILLAAGASARIKRLEIAGLDEAELARRLGAPPPER